MAGGVWIRLAQMQANSLNAVVPYPGQSKVAPR